MVNILAPGPYDEYRAELCADCRVIIYATFLVFSLFLKLEGVVTDNMVGERKTSKKKSMFKLKAEKLWLLYVSRGSYHQPT